MIRKYNIGFMILGFDEAKISKLAYICNNHRIIYDTHSIYFIKEKLSINLIALI